MASKEDKTFRLWILLTQAKDTISSARAKELSKYHITGREAAILHAICSIGESAIPIQVSRWLYRKPNTVASILNRMEKKGLVQLTKDTKIKNIVRINLTDAGKRAYKLTLKRESIYRILGSINDDDNERLATFLTKFRDLALKETGETINRPEP
jgi:DNA-binding MarR family transcriptional regulator